MLLLNLVWCLLLLFVYLIFFPWQILAGMAVLAILSGMVSEEKP